MCVIVSRFSALRLLLFAEEGAVECTVQTEPAVLQPQIRKLQKECVVVQAAANADTNNDASAAPQRLLPSPHTAAASALFAFSKTWSEKCK